MLDKLFVPSKFEQRLYESTEQFFKADVKSNKTPYTIMMPPPNVTGSLHLGHALNDTLQDILVRFHRKLGYDVLWQPGTDHAGIATQIVVERQLAEQGITRAELGRDAFIEKVWQWKEQSGNTIVNQKRRLCISPDWQRSRFTMDEGLSKAVMKVFVKLYKEGLIYKAKRLVNWDTKLQTAISDLEVENRDQKGSLWYISYAIEGCDEKLTVATTRPETLFGDTAVAVHPKDERYQHLVGKNAILPLSGRLIPIISDEYCDPEKGTGAVKITPGHDMNDFAVGARHSLPMLNIMDAFGKLIAPVPTEYIGLTFAEARKKVLLELEALNILEKTETISNSVPYSERSNVEVQPWLTDQWFVDAETLAGPAIQAVEEGRTKFFPQNYENIYFDWLRNIQPWCISRQIWWGHQIPAWQGPDGHIFVEETEEDAQREAFTHYGKTVELVRDKDVLDTWFSSALWPFGTIGFPDETPELKRYYPSDVLTTGFDIIFFWVARMMMMGLHFMDDVPFKTVYIHALVRDEKGQKMSKSKGNIIDPLEMIDKYGADALRFTMAQLASGGRDIKIGPAKVEATRNFITKIWNAARFLEMNDVHYDPDFTPGTAKGSVNQWIIQETLTMLNDVSQEISAYRFDLASKALYQFFWGTYCDIYVECLKSLFADDALQNESKKTAMWVFISFLNVLNPFMPIVTECLFEEFVGQGTLMQKPFILNNNEKIPSDVSEVNWAVQFIQEVRSLKGLLGLSQGNKAQLISREKSADNLILQKNWAWISHLARLDKIVSDGKGVPFVVNGSAFELMIGQEISLDELQKLLKDKACLLDIERKHLQKKLENEAFKIAKPDLWQSDNDLCIIKDSEYTKIKNILEGMNII